MHPGVKDDVLFKFNCLNDSFNYNEIQRLIQQMSIDHVVMLDDKKRLDFLKRITNKLQNVAIETFGEFVTSLNLACRIHLLQGVSSVVIDINKTISIILDRNLDDFVNDPIKIHLVAESLYSFLDNDLNLIYLVRNISFYNNFSYFVSLSLIWAALHRVMDLKFKMFRLYELKDLSKIIKKIPIDIVKNQTQFYRILSLISIFQNVYILRDHSTCTYGKYSEFFKFDKSDVEAVLIVWLNKVRSHWESISKVFNPEMQISHIDGTSKITNDKSIEITELLTVDIIGLFDSFGYDRCCI